MCGFFAELCSIKASADESRMVLSRALGALRHRGPDASGAFVARRADYELRLVHARLKVRDLSPAGAQPMAGVRSGSRLVFNGELYGYSSLARELEQVGCRFTSTSDTQVLVAALETWGVEALPKLKGMFALAWWDADSESLLVARDRWGIKPLYWRRRPGGAAVASEVRALLAAADERPELCLEGIASYFAYGSLWGNLTAIDGIHALEPGTWLRIRPGGVEEGKFWRRTSERRPPDMSRSDAIQHVGALVQASVEAQLSADVPVGVFLSGGIDSGAIVAAIPSELRSRILAVTVGFSPESRRFDERIEAAAAAKRCDLRHEVVELSPAACIEDLPAVLRAMDLPSVDGPNTWFVSKAVRSTGTVVALSGLGGDEVFGGYPHLRHAALYGRLLRMLGHRKPFATGGAAIARVGVQASKALALLASGGSAQGCYSIRRSLFGLPADLRLFHPSLVERWISAQGQFLHAGEDTAEAPLDEQSWLEIGNYMRNTLLRDADCMSMAHALEVRVPLLDEALVDFVMALPVEWRVQAGRQKPLLSEAAGLAAQAPRQKQGFSLPFVEWLRGPLREEVMKSTSPGGPLDQFVRAAESQALWRRFDQGDTRLWTRVWSLYVLAHWLARPWQITRPVEPDLIEVG